MLADPDVLREPLDELKYIPLSERDARTYLSFGANIRERFEVNDLNFGTGSNREESYLLSRSEAHVDLRIHGEIQMFLQLQSDESPGKQHPAPVDQDRLGIEQGFVAVSEPLSNGEVAIRIGRQENGFDLQRFLSVRDGPNVRQSYDGLVVGVLIGSVGHWEEFCGGPISFPIPPTGGEIKSHCVLALKARIATLMGKQHAPGVGG